jgi:cytidylate kinase (EC 2.7.4.14)
LVNDNLNLNLCEKQIMIIAIDGFSACGKSTLAKDLALRLGFGYIDTGAMYRCCTLLLIQSDLTIDQTDAFQKLIKASSIHFEAIDGKNVAFLNGTDVSAAIRSYEVNQLVSEVAALPFVRRLMVDQQRKMAQTGDYILDGRDIGTVVFPDASLKIFVSADLEIRVERRWNELLPNPDVSRAEIAKNLEKRDHIDSNRRDSPLKKATDAKLLDNSNMSKTEQLELVLDWVNSVRQST